MLEKRVLHAEGSGCMQAAYGDTAAFRATLSRQAAMYVQQTAQSIHEDASTLIVEEEVASDAWIEVTKPLQFLVVESQVSAHPLAVARKIAVPRLNHRQQCCTQCRLLQWRNSQNRFASWAT